MVEVDCTLNGRGINVVVNGKKILDNISFSFTSGVNGIVGPNGSGKTTLLKAILGIIGYQGTINYCGKKIHNLLGKASYMPATPTVDPLATVLDVLKAGLYGTGQSIREAVYFLERFLSREYLYRRFSTLSSGEQRLVCLSRALSRMSKVVLLDEPLSFLDIKNQVKVLKILNEYSIKYNSIIIIAIHEIHYLSVLDKLLLLSQGRIVYEGSFSKLTKTKLEEAYSVKVMEVVSDDYKGFLPIISGYLDH